MTTSTCHQCGQPLTGDGPCPTCMWQIVQTPDQLPTVLQDTKGLPVIPGHEIIEELARGGMGIVYRAQQKDPHREVALKMLLPFDTERHDVRERFQVEINALAELDHPGILPLYLVGDTGDRPWFTMKLAAGGSLATRLKRKRAPSDPRGAAKLIADMADAVQHAHAHGVLHRDIKPGNILFDERGGAYLADFGLAKLLDSTADMTRTAAVLGTPCYMAPEVAEKGAKSATTSSDVYGLGAVLYELLSGRPPFIVEGMAAMVKKVIEDEPERPSTIAAHVPRDLELVCLTCLSKDPRKRYASAADVAADLRRWLNGEPVAARRAGTVVRLWAWARRRPALATVSVALILTVLVSATWLAIANHQLKAALADARESRIRADDQSEFLIGEFGDSLAKIGRIELIERACAAADKRDRPIDNAGHKRRARLLLRWAAANWAGGDGTGAAAAKLREAISSMEAVVRKTSGDADALKLATEARCRLAEILADTASFDEALSQLNSAELAISSPGILNLDEAIYLQAEIDRTRAVIWSNQRQEESDGLTESIKSAARSTGSFRAWLAREPEKRERTIALAAALRAEGKAWYNSGGEHPDHSDLEKALPLFREGAALVRTLPNRTPDEDFELARCAGWIGDCLLRLTDQGSVAAEPFHVEEFNIVTSLTAQDPLNGFWQFKLATSHLSLAELSRDAGKPDDAATHWTECRKIFARLYERAPAVREWTLNYVISLRRDGLRALGKDDKATATRLLAQCLTVARPLVLAQPASRTTQDGWKQLNDSVGKEWTDRKELPQASAAFRSAVAVAEVIAAVPGESQSWWEWTLAHYHRKLASALKSAGELKDALVSNLAALEIRSRHLRRRSPQAVEDPAAVANVSLTTAASQIALDQHDDALATAGRCLDLYLECRDMAGPALEWAEAVRKTIAVCVTKDDPLASASRTLAARAAKGFFPPEKRSALSEKEQACAGALEQIAASSGR